MTERCVLFRKLFFRNAFAYLMVKGGHLIMARYQYLIVGGGMTADAAARGIKEVHPNATIAIVGGEFDPPYNRPPLTKGLWKGDKLDSIWSNTQETGVTLELGRRITSLDPSGKRATDDKGATYEFDKCLLATGGQPRRLKQGD